MIIGKGSSTWTGDMTNLECIVIFGFIVGFLYLKWRFENQSNKKDD